ncbi:MAG: hypothetical protein M0036_18965 [Desulfobacteraceae bacterium]|nr:hypothetical protein [Desulfobacteraceae bacterium]
MERYRIRYWVQDTVESGHWEITPSIREDTARAVMDLWSEEGRMPELLEE